MQMAKCPRKEISAFLSNGREEAEGAAEIRPGDRTSSLTGKGGTAVLLRIAQGQGVAAESGGP